MKRRDLIKRIEDLGCQLLRRGGKHDIDHDPNPVIDACPVQALIVAKMTALRPMLSTVFIAGIATSPLSAEERPDFAGHIQARNEGFAEVSLARYQKLAVEGLEENVLEDYRQRLRPNRRVVMIILDSEHTAGLFFFAFQAEDSLEVVAFTPIPMNAGEWKARFLDLENEAESRFSSLYTLASEQIEMRKAPSGGGEFIPGDSELRVYAGEGDAIRSAAFRGVQLALQPEKEERLLKCIDLAGDLLGSELRIQIAAESHDAEGGPGQPATRSESDSVGGDKPQPESEGPSR